MRKLVSIFVIFFSINHFVHAASVTIDFEGFRVSSSFNSGIEDEISITAVGTGEATSPNGFGNPRIGISAGALAANPIYRFEMLTGELFKFTSLDFVFENLFGFAGKPDLTVQGFGGATLLGTDVFSASSTYQTFSSINLAGVEIDVLLLDFGISTFNPTIVDNVVLDLPVAVLAVPAPTTICLIILGLIGMRMNIPGKSGLET